MTLQHFLSVLCSTTCIPLHDHTSIHNTIIEYSIYNKSALISLEELASLSNVFRRLSQYRSLFSSACKSSMQSRLEFWIFKVLSLYKRAKKRTHRTSCDRKYTFTSKKCTIEAF